MKPSDSIMACGLALAAAVLGANAAAQSQGAPGGVPNVSGTYSGRRCVPANGPPRGDDLSIEVAPLTPSGRA